MEQEEGEDGYKKQEQEQEQGTYKEHQRNDLRPKANSNRGHKSEHHHE